MATFYDELAQSVKEAWLEDRRRVIRETLELGICFAVFVFAIILMCGER